MKYANDPSVSEATEDVQTYSDTTEAGKSAQEAHSDAERARRYVIVRYEYVHPVTGKVTTVTGDPFVDPSDETIEKIREVCNMVACRDCANVNMTVDDAELFISVNRDDHITMSYKIYKDAQEMESEKTIKDDEDDVSPFLRFT